MLLIFPHKSQITYQNSCYWAMGQTWCQPIKLQYSLKLNISRKKWMLKFNFGMQINIEVFYELIISFCVYIARHAQSNQNKKFVYLCNISRKLWGMNLIVRYYNVTFDYQLSNCLTWLSIVILWSWFSFLQINTKVF